jgi:hypothetical protein
LYEGFISLEKKERPTMLQDYSINRRRKAAALLAIALALIMGESVAFGQAKPVPKRTTVTTEMACQHLYLRVADGPNSANYRTRVQMLGGSGLAGAEIAAVIRAANVYLAAVVPADARAAALRQGLRDKTIAPGAAQPQFTGIEQEKENILAASFSQLKVQLGPEGASKLETFLNDVVKPTIVAYTY